MANLKPNLLFDYALLCGERSLCSVANLTRADGDAFAL